MDCSFALTSRGVRSQSGNVGKTASKMAFWGGVLTGNPTAAGAGLLAGSEQSTFIPYEDVRTVRVSPASNYVELKGDRFDKPVALFCPPETFDQVVQVVRERCTTATFD